MFGKFDTNYTASIHRSDESVSISLEHHEVGMLTDVYVASDEVTYSSSDSEGTTYSISGKNAVLANKVRQMLTGLNGSVLGVEHLVNQVQLSLLAMGPKPKNRAPLELHAVA